MTPGTVWRRRVDDVPDPPRPNEGRSHRHVRDVGTSVIEVVCAIALTAILIIPLVEGLRTGIRASAINEAAANAETAIVDAADRINRAPQSCDYKIYAQASVQIRGWEAGQASVTHEHYDPIVDAWQPGGCRFASPTEDLVQRLTITITTPNLGVTRSLQVVKSNV